MKKQKIIAMILVFLTVVTVAGIVSAKVPTVIGAKKTEAVELMNTTSSQPEDFLGNIIPTNKLKQYQMLEGEEDKLFVASPKCDLESIIKEFKKKREVFFCGNGKKKGIGFNRRDGSYGKTAAPECV